MKKKYTAGIAIFFLSILPVLSKFHPEIRWNELRNGKFIVIYPRGYENSASRVFKSAGKIYSDLKKFWGWRIRGKIRIVLRDDLDIAGSKSTFFPYNQLELNLFPPDNFSINGRWENLVEDLLRYEINSLFILNSGSNTIYALRKYLGFNTLFFPAGFIPAWVFSGMAANCGTEQGINGMFNRELITLTVGSYIRKYGRFPNIGSLRSNLHLWPVNYSKLYFGIYFISYIKNVFDTEKLRSFVNTYTKHPLPILIRGSLLPVMLSMTKRFKMAFGKKPNGFVSLIEKNVKNVNSPGNPAVRMLTESGFLKRYPVKISKNQIVYYENNFRSSPKIKLMDVDLKKIRILTANYDVTGIGLEKDRNSVLFTARDYFKNYYYYSDLYSIDLNTLNVRRLTYGSRLFSPVSNGRSVFCIKREKEWFFVAKISPDGKKIIKISPEFEFISDLSISSSGKLLAFCAKMSSSKRFVAILNINTGEVSKLEEKNVSNYSPEFISEKELAYLSFESQKTSLKRYNFLSGKTSKYRNFKASLISDPAAFGEGKLIAPILFGNGYDLGIIDPGASETGSVIPVKIINPGSKIRVNPGRKSFAYDPFRDFLPQYFTLSFRSGGNEIQSGLVMSGFDSLKKNYFKFKLMRGPLSKSWNSYFNYIFEESYGTFGIKYTNFTNWSITQLSEKYSGKYEKLRFYFNIPLLHLSRGSLELYTDLHFENESERVLNNGLIREKTYNGFRAAISFDSTRRYFDSLWKSDGISFTLSYSKESKRFGSAGNIHAFSLEYRQFLRLNGLSVLGLRFVIADSGGDEKREFYMGGVHGNGGIRYAGENNFDLMRGFPSGFFRGSGGYLVNLEYRFQLIRVERPFIIFKSIERIYFSFFSDIGKLWKGMDLKDSTAVSTGSELNIVLYLGKYRYVLTAGVGKGLSPEHDPRFYFRVGSSF